MPGAPDWLPEIMVAVYLKSAADSCEGCAKIAEQIGGYGQIIAETIREYVKESICPLQTV